MVANTSKMDAVLNPMYIEGFMLEKLNPTMNFIGLFGNPTNLGNSTTFKYFENDTSFEDDITSGVLSEPVEFSEGSTLPEIEISGFSSKVGDLTKFGFKMSFTEELREQEHLYNFVQRTLEGGAYAMERKINRDIYNNLVNNAGAATITLNDGAWDDSTAIDKDLKALQRAMDIIGYKHNLTDAFVGKDSYYGAEDFFDATFEKGFTPNDLFGTSLHKVNEVSSGLLGIDLPSRPAEVFYRHQDKYSSYKNSFIHVDRYETQGQPHNLVIEVWAQMGFAVYDPKGIVYQEGV